MGSLATPELKKNYENGTVKGNGYALDVGLIQDKQVGAIIEATKPETIPKLFTPFTIRDLTFQNRILVIHFLSYNVTSNEFIHLLRY